MSTYKYVCPVCGKEKIWKSRQEPTCLECDVKMKRVYSKPGIILRGGGFYSTEDRGK